MSGRQAVVVVAGCLALAVAVWLVPASVHVVEWSAAGPSRVALFASRGRLVWLVAAALGASAVLIARGRRGGDVSPSIHACSRMCLLWLWAVPYLPWLPDRLPALLVLSGPVRWVVAGAAAIATAGRFVRLSPQLVQPGRFRALVFAASLAAYAALGVLNARTIGPGGDEPHYLIIAQSLLVDGDLKIEDNHQRREYRAFWGGDLRPDYMTRGIDGEIYSVHAPGLPAMLLPAYAAGGYLATVLVLSLIAALTALAVFDLAKDVAGERVAIVTWLATCFTVPFVPHAWLIFPEMPGALVVAWAALWISRPLEDRTATWIWRGVALAILPWLHTKFAIFTALFGLALAWRLRSRPKALVALAAPVAISGAAWLGFFYAFYGTINPEAPYGNYTKLFVVARNIPRGFLGLLFDQKFGLLPYAPVYAFAVAGCWLMLRRSGTRFLGAVLLLVTAVHVGSTTRLYMWWGGTSAPARFLVPILPCLAPMLALAIEEIRSRTARTAFAAALALSVLVAAVGVGWPARLFLYSDSRGYARLLDAIQSGAPLTFLLPTFTFEDWISPVRTLAPWLAAGAVATMAASLAARGTKAGGVWLATTGAMTMLVAAGLLAGRVDAKARGEMARRGAVDLIWAYDDSLRPFEYGVLGKVDETRLRALSAVAYPYPTPAFALPQGAYEARVWFGGGLQRQGEVAVTSSGRVTFAKNEGLLPNPAVVPFELPVATGRLAVAVADASVAGSVTRVEIVPTVLTSRSERESRPVRRIESVPDRPGAYLAYIDEHAYPEGGVFWTRGTEGAEVLLAPGAYQRVALTMHLGPGRGDVRFSVAGEERVVAVEANGSAEVQLVLPHGLRLVPIRVQSPTSFRPSEVDPSSDDTRLLGCQVRIRVD